MSEEREKYKEFVGRELPVIKPYAVTSEAIQKYAKACHETDPACLEGKVAPPAFTSVYTFKTFGSSAVALKGLIKNPLKILHAGQVYEYLAPVKPGDELASTAKVGDVYQRGASLWVAIDITTKNQQGAVVSKTRSTIMVREGGF